MTEALKKIDEEIEKAGVEELDLLIRFLENKAGYAKIVKDMKDRGNKKGALSSYQTERNQD